MSDTRDTILGTVTVVELRAQPGDTVRVTARDDDDGATIVWCEPLPTPLRLLDRLRITVQRTPEPSA